MHVFVLMVFLEGKLVSGDMHFRNLNECIWYAQTLHKQGKKLTSYCLPKWVNENTKVY